jgi:hypothetical protein
MFVDLSIDSELDEYSSGDDQPDECVLKFDNDDDELESDSLPSLDDSSESAIENMLEFFLPSTNFVSGSFLFKRFAFHNDFIDSAVATLTAL